MEAEINSPLCKLRPGRDLHPRDRMVPDALGNGISRRYRRRHSDNALASHLLGEWQTLSVRFLGVFFAGRLVAHLYSEHGLALGTAEVTAVDPVDLVSLDKEVTPIGRPARISLHLEDWNGLDRGSLQEVQVQ